VPPRLYAIAMSALLKGYIDRTGQLVVPPTLAVANPFRGGLAHAKPFGTHDFGYLDRTGGWAVAPRLHFFGGWSDGVSTYNVGGRIGDRGGVVGGKWGWIGDGVHVTERFDAVGKLQCELVGVLVGNAWGYADRHGNLRIAPQFEWVDEFQRDGVAVASKGGKDGYLRPDGSWLIEPRYERAGPFSAGRGRVYIGDAWYVVDASGTVISEGYDDILAYVEGMARVHRGPRCAFVDLQGRIIGGQWFDESNWYGDGLAPVRRGDDWFLFSATGQLFGPFAQTMPAHGGLARFVERGGGVGFMRADGSVAVAPHYDSALGFSEGLAPVRRDGKWTFVDASGRELHTPHWEATAGFAEGLCAVRHGGRWGVVDASGQMVVPPHFASIEPFSSGLAAVVCAQRPSKATPPDPRWHVVPAEGLAHRGFANAGVDDAVRATLCFGRTPAKEQIVRIEQTIRNWRELLAFDGPSEPTTSTWIADYATSVRVEGTADPVGALELLLASLRALDLPIQDATFARFREDPEVPFVEQTMYPGKHAVPHPDDPRGATSFPDFDAYMRAAFDSREIPPRSENRQYLRAARYNPRTESLAFDERVFSLYLPDVRICYGVTSGEVVEPDDRTEEIADAVQEALAERFDRAKIWVYPGNREWEVPTPMTRDGDEGVEKLVACGRVGYCFGIDASNLLQDVGPDVFRYREPELMEALAAVIRRLGLAPVLTWQRFGDPLDVLSYPGIAHPMNPTTYAINLWER
jgi:hypothetical protein